MGVRVRSAVVKPSEEEGREQDSKEEKERMVIDRGEKQQQDGDDLQDIWSTSYESSPSGELDYCAMLNRVLPPDIRVLGWAPTPQGFSARFCASHRTYRYFFDTQGLDVTLMQSAAQRLVGDHDFRNFCKMDATAVHSFRRVIHSAKILEVGQWRWAVDTGVQSLFCV